MKRTDSKYLPKTKHYLNAYNMKGYWIIYLSFIISFVCCAVAAILSKNLFIEICSFFIVFGGAFTINAYQIHKGIKLKNEFDKSFEINQEILSNIALAILIFDEKGRVVSIDVGNDVTLNNNIKDYLDKLFALFLVPIKVQKEIRDIIVTNNLKHSRQEFGSYEYGENFYDLIVMRLTHSKDYKAVSFARSNNKALIGKKHFKDAFFGFYKLDSNMQFISINKYFAKILGYSKDELMILHPNLNNLIDFNNISSSEQNELKGNWQGFLSFHTKYGEKVICFVIQKANLNVSGDIECIIGYVVKLYDPSLMLKSRGFDKEWINRSWNSLFENSIEPVAMLNNSGVLIKSNNAFDNIMPNVPFNKKFCDAFINEGALNIDNEIQEIIASNKHYKVLKNLIYKDGLRKLSIYLRGIKDAENNVLGFIVSINDNTHQTELEASLSHAQRMQTIGQLVGAVAHDFNNLLTAITGFCDILLLRHAIGDPSFVNVIQIKQSADRASNLVKRLLAFSRKQTLKLEIIYLSAFFSDISTLIQRLVGTEIIVKKEIDPNLWLVEFDPVQLEQVVLNLIVNAQQAMSHGGTVNIKVSNMSLYDNHALAKDFVAPGGEHFPPFGEYVALEFTDSGSGIDGHIIQKIFEPFFTTKSDKSGTGLGLATVYGIVRQSEGYIYVKSKVGKGTTFLILLKKHNISKKEIAKLESDREKKVLAFTDSAKADLSGKGLIALVEDEEAVRLFAKSALIIKGYEVIEFASAKMALEAIQKDLPKIDLIISDVMMPEMSGPEFISEIHKNYPSIKVIFISGFGEDAFTEEYGNKRDFNFLPKPFSLKQLVGKVKEVITQ